MLMSPSMMLSFSYETLTILMAIAAVLCLGVALLIFLSKTNSGTPQHPQVDAPNGDAASTPQSAANIATPPAAGVASPDAAASPGHVQEDMSTDAAPLDPITEPPVPERFVPEENDAIKAEKAGNFEEAARLWHERGNPWAEMNALRKCNEKNNLAELELAMGQIHDAVNHMQAILAESPSDEVTRLRLVQCLLDLGRVQQAKDLVEVVIPNDAPLKATAPFLTRSARSFEAYGDIRSAQKYYRSAASRGVEVDDLSTRLVYLNQISRLLKTTPPSTQKPGSQDLLKRAVSLADSSTDVGKLDAVVGDKPLNTPPPLNFDHLEPHKIIVGHLALGGDPNEVTYSVRSIMSTASRFTLMRLVGERPASAVFEAVDCLLDCPVAIKVSRISAEGADLDVLQERLHAISLLNHPNLTKTTFVDRFGPLVRSVTEFHAGGNVASLITKMGNIGLPLMLRLLIQVAAGIGHAHRFGILHGDLRPENIMIGHDQLIKVVDFALQPWPVRFLPTDEISSRSDIPVQMADHEILTDITQFADLVEYLLEYTIVSPHLAQNMPENYDPVEELREVVSRARQNSFSSILQVRRILLQVLSNALPGQG